MHKTLRSDKFEGTNFKYNVQISTQKHPSKVFLETFLNEICNQGSMRASTNFSPKIQIPGNFDYKFKGSHFCTKLCNRAHLKMLTSNMAILFYNFSPNIPQSGILGVEFNLRCFSIKFWVKLVSTSNMIIIFKNFCQKRSNKIYLVPNLKIFFFAQNVTVRQIWVHLFQV